MKQATVAVLGLSFGAAAHAQPYSIDSSTIDGGGGTISSATYELSGTIAQHDASTVLVSSTYELTGGFWTGSVAASRLCADQNGDGLVTPADFSAWLVNYNASNPRADTNQDGSISPADFSAWLAAYNGGVNGPVCNP